MKRLLMLLSALALFGAFAFGSTVVRADDNSSGSEDNTQCQQGSTQTGGDTGTDRARIAESRDGTSGDDNEQGSGSDDTISGRSGDDQIEGEQGDDDLCGDQGDDHIDGGSGNDTINGGPGDDDLNGQAGDDLIVGGKGHDRISGGPGRDRIRARDGVRDHINCGAGIDTVRADRADVVASNCEHVSR